MIEYKCKKCSTSGVKLWRQSAVFLDNIELLCCDCSTTDQGKTLTQLNEYGSYISDYHGRMTDQIGRLVPAVPTDDGSFWGYTSVPQDRVDWWKALPNRKTF